MIRAATLAMMCLPAAAQAQQYLPCDDYRSSAFALAEPWTDFTDTYAQGAVRLAITDTGEPAAGSYYLVVLWPSADESEGRQCTLISFDDSLGFAGLSLVGAAVSGDLTSGLIITLPARRWMPATDTYKDASLTVTVDQAAGTVTAVLH